MYQCFEDSRNSNGQCEGSEFKLAYCAKNFVILITDGQWNKGGDPPIENYKISCSIDDGSTYSADPVVPAYVMHKKGFTNAKTGYKSRIEALYGIGLWLKGPGAQSIKNVAMYGSFKLDGGKSWPDSLAGYPSGKCFMNDCSEHIGNKEGKGSACTPLPPSSSDWDENNDNIPDTFFDATGGAEIKNAIMDAIYDAIKRASSGTTVVAIPPSSATSSSIMVRTYFYPEKVLDENRGDKSIKWVGELEALWIDSDGLIRENTYTSNETVNTKILSPTKDYPLVFHQQDDGFYKGYVYTDLNEDGKPVSCKSEERSKLEDIKAVFASGSMLVTANPDLRVIKTALSTGSNGIATNTDVVDFKFTDDVNDPVVNKLKNYWKYDANDLGECSVDCAKSVIRYIRGYDKPTPAGASFRLRQADDTASNNPRAWKLGDAIYSTPRVVPNAGVNGYHVKYNDKSYVSFVRNVIKKQMPVIIMGANDGMIHSFLLGKIEPTKEDDKQTVKLTTVLDNNGSAAGEIGQELWAYIPHNVLPYLRWYCEKNYCHIPMLDTTFTLVDASINGEPDEDKTEKSWSRLLIAQMGLGGTKISVGNETFSSSIIVLDITDHTKPPKLLWERPLPDNTLTFATPGIVRLGSGDKNGTWYLVIGSGPQKINSTSLTYPTAPKIYVFNLKTGEKVAERAITNVSGQAVGDMLAVDMDLPTGDYQVDNVYFGVYNDSSGALYRLRIRDGDGYITNPNEWKIEMVFNAGRPVFAAPALTVDERGMRWLYFGTGIYLTSSHAKDMSDEKLFGIIEPDGCWRGSGQCPIKDVLNTTTAEFRNGKAVQYACQCEGGIQITSGFCEQNESNNTTTIAYPSYPNGPKLVITEVSGAVLYGVEGCAGLKGETALSCVQNKIYTYTATKDEPTINYRGWVKILPKQKLYSSPVVVGGAVLATPFLLGSVDDICSMVGKTSILALYYTTGTPYYQPLIMRPEGTNVDPNSVKIESTVVIAVGPPPTKTSVVVKQNEGTVTALTHVEGGAVATKIKSPIPPTNKFIQWFIR